MEQNRTKMQSLALMPTWSVAIVMTIFVVVSLLVERSIRRLSNWLRKTNRKPLFEAVEKMKEDLMLLGFISLLLTATSGAISNICILTSFYLSVFSPFAPNLGFRMALKIMFHSFISVIHLLVGVVYCLVSWAVGLPKQAPINKELLTVLTPVTFCYALGHVMSNVSLAAIDVSFTHTIREVSPPRMPVAEIQLHRKLLEELLGNMSHSSAQFLCVKRGRDVSK